MQAPSVLASEIERHAELPAGSGEQFVGYGVMGLPCASGRVLAMERFPASSIGPAYTSAVAETRHARIELEPPFLGPLGGQ